MVVIAIVLAAGCGKAKSKGPGQGAPASSGSASPAAEVPALALTLTPSWDARLLTVSGYIDDTQFPGFVSLTGARKPDGSGYSVDRKSGEGAFSLAIPFASLQAGTRYTVESYQTISNSSTLEQRGSFEFDPTPPLALTYSIAGKPPGAHIIEATLEPCPFLQEKCAPRPVATDAETLTLSLGGPPGAEVTLDGQTVTLTEAPATITIKPLARLGAVAPDGQLELALSGSAPGTTPFTAKVRLPALATLRALLAAGAGKPVVFPDDVAGAPHVVVGARSVGTATALRDVDRLLDLVTVSKDLPPCSYSGEGKTYHRIRSLITDTVTLIDRKSGKTLGKKVFTGKAMPCPRDVLAWENETGEQVRYAASPDTVKAALDAFAAQK